jgi:RimJ/RimL family protein N-acetyltransferase
MHAAALESVAEVYPWMAWCHRHYSLDEARQWVAVQEKLAQEGTAYEFAILGEGGRFLGGCGINQISKANRFANLGYWVRTSAMGRGVAPAAARLVAEYAFRETDLIRLEIVCAVANTRSQRVAEKVGAVREGVMRSRLLLPSGPSDAVMYSLVRPTLEGRRNNRVNPSVLRVTPLAEKTQAPRRKESSMTG